MLVRTIAAAAGDALNPKTALAAKVRNDFLNAFFITFLPFIAGFSTAEPAIECAPQVRVT